MLIERANEDEIPKGAIRLTGEEVFEYMVNVIRKWPNSADIWALKFGNPILSSAVVISNTVILNFYRNKLKLKNYGRFTLFVPIVIIPSIFDQIYQNSITTRSIILQDDCPICTTTRSMFIQLGTGIVYPMMGAIAGSYMFANKMGTFNLNSSGPNNMAKEFLIHLIRSSRPFYNRLAVFVIGHMLLSYTVTYYQTENFEFLRLKMFEQHKEEVRQRSVNQSLNN